MRSAQSRALAVDVAAGLVRRQPRGDVGEDRRPGTRAPWPCARSSGARRRCPLRGSAPRPPVPPPPPPAAPRRSRGTTCRRPARTGAPARRRAARWRAPARRPAAARSRRARACRRAARDRVGHRPAVALPVQRGRAAPSASRDRLRGGRAASSGTRNGWKRAAEVAILEQLLVADREERPAQRGEDRQLIVGPLDRHQRRAQRLDLLAIVERRAADEQVPDAARLERLDVRPRDVLAEADEAAEQDADVPRLRSARACAGSRRSVTVQPLCVHQPVDVRADRIGQRRLDLARRDDIAARTARGTGSATTDGWPGCSARDGSSGM